MSPEPRPSYKDLESRIAELEQALQESRRPLGPETTHDPDLLQTIFDTIEQPIAFVSQEYRYQAVNQAYSHYFAREREQILGRSVAELCGQSVFESEIRPNLNRCLAGETVVYEVQVQFPGKGLRWMEMEYIPHRNERGEILGVIAHGQDITRRKASDSELQDREADNQALLNATHDGVVLLDRQGTILVANQAYAQRFGLTPLNMTGECLWDVLPQQVIPRRKAKVEEVFATGQPRRMVDEREGLWNDTILYPIFDPQGRVAKVAVDARDITEHKQMEEDLRLALEKACQREQELDGLLNAAHEVLKYTSFAEAAPAILQSCRRQIGVQLAFLAVLPAKGTQLEDLFFDPDQTNPPGIDVAELFTPFKNELLSGDTILTTQSIPASLKSSWDEDGAVQAHLLLIPLRIEEATTGMLGLVGSSGFGPETVRLATGYSELAGTALRNSRTLSLLREMNSHMEKWVKKRTQDLLQVNAELQQTIQALRENEARFTAFMDHFPGGAFIKEVNGPIIFRNQYLKNVFEKNRSWIGQTTHEILPDSVAQAILEDEQHLSQTTPGPGNFPFRTARDGPRWLNYTSS